MWGFFYNHCKLYISLSGDLCCITHQAVRFNSGTIGLRVFFEEALLK